MSGYNEGLLYSILLTLKGKHEYRDTQGVSKCIPPSNKTLVAEILHKNVTELFYFFVVCVIVRFLFAFYALVRLVCVQNVFGGFGDSKDVERVG